jgi:hypothetical protein
LNADEYIVQRYSKLKEAMAGMPGPCNNSLLSTVIHPMARYSYCLLVLLFPSFCFSQVGINVKAFLGQSRTLDTVLISQDGVQASVEYNFRLKQKRIEFRPGLGYRFTWNGAQENGYFKSVDFDFNTAVYPFDFAGDCHCPTFSKGGDLFKKGFFLELSPGVGYQTFTRVKSDPDDPSRLPIQSKNLIWKLGGSAGLDIGLSDPFTLTPMLSLTLLSASDWEGLRNDGSKGNLKDYMYLGAGIRLTYNTDENHRKRF